MNKVDKLTLHGDLICPECSCHIVTPDYAIVIAGTGRCPRCKSSFMVTKKIALDANHLHRRINHNIN